MKDPFEGDGPDRSRRYFLAGAAASVITSLGSITAGAQEHTGAKQAGAPDREGFPGLAGALKGFSAELIRDHLEIYKGYREALKRLEARERRMDLADLGPYDSSVRRFTLARLELVNAVRLHRLYFSFMTPAATSPGPLFKGAAAVFSGSLDGWWVRFQAVALSVKGWAATVVDDYTGGIQVVGTDGDAQWPLGVTPIFCVDMKEHAYAMDFPGDPVGYLEAWRRRLDWDMVEKAISKTVTEKR